MSKREIERATNKQTHRQAEIDGDIQRQAYRCGERKRIDKREGRIHRKRSVSQRERK